METMLTRCEKVLNFVDDIPAHESMTIKSTAGFKRKQQVHT